MYKQSLIKAHFSLNEIQLNFFPYLVCVGQKYKIGIEELE